MSEVSSVDEILADDNATASKTDTITTRRLIKISRDMVAVPSFCVKETQGDGSGGTSRSAVTDGIVCGQTDSGSATRSHHPVAVAPLPNASEISDPSSRLIPDHGK
jgi:hypothetical protein